MCDDMATTPRTSVRQFARLLRAVGLDRRLPRCSTLILTDLGAANGPLTVTELMTSLGFSRRWVWLALAKLEDAGYVERHRQTWPSGADAPSTFTVAAQQFADDDRASGQADYSSVIESGESDHFLINPDQTDHSPECRDRSLPNGSRPAANGATAPTPLDPRDQARADQHARAPETPSSSWYPGSWHPGRRVGSTSTTTERARAGARVCARPDPGGPFPEPHAPPPPPLPSPPDDVQIRTIPGTEPPEDLAEVDGLFRHDPHYRPTRAYYLALQAHCKRGIDLLCQAARLLDYAARKSRPLTVQFILDWLSREKVPEERTSHAERLHPTAAPERRRFDQYRPEPPNDQEAYAAAAARLQAARKTGRF